MFDFSWLRPSRSTDPRRKGGPQNASWRERMRRAIGWPMVVAAGFWACASLIVSSGDEPLGYVPGKELFQPVISRVSFERVNLLRTNDLLRKEQQQVPNYFRYNSALANQIKGEIRSLYLDVKASVSYEAFVTEHGAQWKLDQPLFDVLKAWTEKPGSTLEAELASLEKNLKQEPMTARPGIERTVNYTGEYVELETGEGRDGLKRYRQVPSAEVTYAANTKHVTELAKVVVPSGLPAEARPLFESIVSNAITPEGASPNPVYIYDEEKTKSELDLKAASVEPVKDTYNKGDRLVAAGKITQETYALLEAEHAEYLKQRETDKELAAEWNKRRLGLMGVTFLLTIGLSVFTFKCQPRIAQKAPRALGVATLLIGMAAFDRFVLLEIGNSPMWAVTTVTMTAAILTVAYSQLFAFGATAALALLTALILGAPYGLMVMLVTVAAVTTLMLREIRTRMKMVKVGVATAIAAGVSAAFTLAADGQPISTDVVVASIAAFVGVGIVLVLLPVIERAFRITTSQTLLEWADTSKPILRELIEKAPGTWQHSHLLGSMAETAAEEVGANGLLVRVGAYYHDIGKTCKPHYFIENQDANISAHRGLAPSMSLLVILSHVKDGLALAKEHGVPPVLHQFIAEHHGTTVVRYFHHLASEEAKASGYSSREVSDTDFRYPGPKPRTKETAILMVCDGVEGAVRSLHEPTPGRIEAVVHDVLMARLMDGQFDDCDITLRELALVERSLVKSLRAIHHGRIAYPKANESSRARAKTA